MDYEAELFQLHAELVKLGEPSFAKLALAVVFTLAMGCGASRMGMSGFAPDWA